MAVTFYGEKGTLYVDRAQFRLTPEKGSGAASDGSEARHRRTSRALDEFPGLRKNA